MRLFSALAAATALFATAASAEPRDLSNFDSVSASGRVEVEIAIGPSFGVDLTGPRAERVVTRVSQGELIIESRRRGWNAGHGRDALVRVTLPSLTGLDASAGASVSARDVNADRFTLEASSGASVRVQGACQVLTLDVSSGADVRANTLTCAIVRADASSGANATVHAVNEISADASSGANLRWSGDAQIRRFDTSSGAHARRVD